jgi:hypothetical protein
MCISKEGAAGKSAAQSVCPQPVPDAMIRTILVIACGKQAAEMVEHLQHAFIPRHLICQVLPTTLALIDGHGPCSCRVASVQRRD